MFTMGLLWGRLIPSSQVERLLKVKDDRIKELTKALEAANEREKVLGQQNLELMEVGRVAAQVMQALPPASRKP